VREAGCRRPQQTVDRMFADDQAAAKKPLRAGGRERIKTIYPRLYRPGADASQIEPNGLRLKAFR